MGGDGTAWLTVEHGDERVALGLGAALASPRIVRRAGLTWMLGGSTDEIWGTVDGNVVTGHVTRLEMRR